MENNTNETLTLDGKPVTKEQLQEAQKNCSPSQRIVEDASNKGAYKTLTRMQE